MLVTDMVCSLKVSLGLNNASRAFNGGPLANILGYDGGFLVCDGWL